MTDLTERLHRAAEGSPPGFSAADILRRVDRRRRRGRAVATSLLVLVVIGASLVAARAIGDSDRDADRASTGPIGTTELTASPWILTAIGGDPVIGGPAWVSFGTDGSVVGDGGCGPFVASWRWDDRSLDVDGWDRRPDGCDRREGSSIVGTPELIAGVLASGPAPAPSEITSGGLRLRSGTPDAAVPWIELTPFGDLDPVVDDSAITGRWFTADGAALQIEAETIDGETSCAAPAPWSLGADGLTAPVCIADVLGLAGTGPWEVRSHWTSLLWLRNGERLAWMRRDVGSTPSEFEDLVGGRWIVRGVPGVQASTGMAWIELHEDGTVRGNNGFCGTFAGRWTADDGVLTGHDLRGPETSSCSPPPLDLQADLGAGLLVSRPDGASDQLQLEAVSGRRDDSLPWVLRRIDRIGEAATADDVVGMWEGQDTNGWGATFSEDGTVEISASGCREVRPWSIADGVITIGNMTDDACRAWVVQLPLPGEVDARIEGTTLWLSGEGGVVSAVRLA